MLVFTMDNVFKLLLNSGVSSIWLGDSEEYNLYIDFPYSFLNFEHFLCFEVGEGKLPKTMESIFHGPVI